MDEIVSIGLQAGSRTCISNCICVNITINLKLQFRFDVQFTTTHSHAIHSKASDNRKPLPFLENIKANSYVQGYISQTLANYNVNKLPRLPQ